ncbi:MAG: 50S ribosomal protein L23 [Alphaproteobacteria bacterium]|nr:50S ribosomal protein L23 [Alphaproteobacteria bacterium]
MTYIINLDKIKGLVYTEKSNTTASNGKYTFEVDASCNKSEIKSLIKKIYNVEVEKVNIINTKSKNKRFKGIDGCTTSIKKAIIKLKENQTINFA